MIYNRGESLIYYFLLFIKKEYKLLLTKLIEIIYLIKGTF
jgi:hypothetical protein